MRCSAACRRSSFPLAVVYKFVDDQGGYLAALITYYGVPLVLPAAAAAQLDVLGFVLAGQPRACSSGWSTRR